jgi:hypothetical protein
MWIMVKRTIVSLLLAVASAGAFAQSASNGATLYQTYCISCHGLPPFGGPELAPNNPALIRSAINGLSGGAMAFLSFLTDSQLADIAAYIFTLESAPPPPPPPPPPVPTPQFDYSDLWYNANESGWGLNLVQHASNQVFGVIYTYEAPNRPIWFVMPGGAWTANTVFTGNLYQVSATALNTTAFKEGPVTQVGTATLTFSDVNHATFSYTVNNVLVTKTIQRQPF